jgi:hypothetical protein
LENAHLPFDLLTALSKAEGLRYPHPRPVEFSLCETAKPIRQGKSLRRTQKVKGKSPSAVRPVDEPFGHESFDPELMTEGLKAEWLRSSRSGPNGWKVYPPRAG